MELANEETGPAPRPHPTVPTPSQPNSHTTAAAPSCNGLNAGNGTALPQARDPPSKDRPVSGIIPPYWSHHRNTSRASQASVDQSPAITLEDHTEDPDSETSRGLWARSVSVDDHVVVQGKTGVGAYVVWNCMIQTLEGGPIKIRMRYSEFDDLRRQLRAAFPHAKNALPALPPKSVFCMFGHGLERDIAQLTTCDFSQIPPILFRISTCWAGVFSKLRSP
ncbi:hypothetical protein AWENTII_005898 [Aspergillus wentii]